MRLTVVLFLLAMTAGARAQAATSAADAMRTKPCAANQLSMTFDTENGNYDGMSHSGALLVLRNYGNQACTVLPKPALTFTDKDRKPVALSFAVPRFMHPGPVQVPVVIPAGAEVTGNLRWVSGEVYDHSTCVTAAFVALPTTSGNLQAAFGFRICGQAGSPLTYEQEPLHRDPTLR